ncbi:MAG: Elongation factor P [Phycisphaerae bacterium]|nr:Elongation factor P [Phycisphaerae bacterium]
MISAIDLRAGNTVIYEGELFIVHEAHRVSKGNWRSYVQTKLKNFKTGSIIDARFGVDDKLDVPFVETRAYEYLYPEGDHLVVMDLESYDQIPLGKDIIGDGLKFLRPNEKLNCQIYQDKVVGVELPNTVELLVKDTPPVVRGATATNQSKDAILETGAKVKVPPFVEPGEKIRVDTRTGEYVERVR